MPRFIRIALIVLCLTSFTGTLFALSSAAEMPSIIQTTLCSQPCLSDGSFCTSASQCPDIRRLKKACCFNACVYCP